MHDPRRESQPVLIVGCMASNAVICFVILSFKDCVINYFRVIRDMLLTADRANDEPEVVCCS
jgi:hypothetical protein